MVMFRQLVWYMYDFLKVISFCVKYQTFQANSSSTADFPLFKAGVSG